MTGHQQPPPAPECRAQALAALGSDLIDLINMAGIAATLVEIAMPDRGDGEAVIRLSDREREQMTFAAQHTFSMAEGLRDRYAAAMQIGHAGGA